MSYSLSDKRTKNVAEAVRKVMGLTNLKENVSMELVTQMKKILADGYVFYFKAHTFHWNVEGSNFPQYHDFFSEIYEEVFDNLDPIAEQIRALGAYAPTALSQLLSMTSLTEAAGVVAPQQMVNDLLSDNEKVIQGLIAGYKLAESANELGLSNFLQDLVDKHKKLSWKLTSTGKGI
jgi:starvation-inducible DNA-binding protein